MCNTAMLLIAMFWIKGKDHYSLGLRSSPQFPYLFQCTLSKVVSRIHLYLGSLLHAHVVFDDERIQVSF